MVSDAGSTLRGNMPLDFFTTLQSPLTLGDFRS